MYHLKYSPLQNPGYDHSRSLKMTQFYRSYMTSWKCLIATMALSSTAYDIFDIEKYHGSEIWVTCHAKSSKLEPFDSLSMVSYLRPIVTLSLDAPFLRYPPLKSTMTLTPRLAVTRGHSNNTIRSIIWLHIHIRVTLNDFESSFCVKFFLRQYVWSSDAWFSKLG